MWISGQLLHNNPSAADHCHLEKQGRLASGRYTPDRQRHSCCAETHMHTYQVTNDTDLSCIPIELIGRYNCSDEFHVGDMEKVHPARTKCVLRELQTD